MKQVRYFFLDNKSSINDAIMEKQKRARGLLFLTAFIN